MAKYRFRKLFLMMEFQFNKSPPLLEFHGDSRLFVRKGLVRLKGGKIYEHRIAQCAYT